ncbi:VOC family protein [[Mycobacterium] burgundiense]|jgi:predicted enzyme related to lactoylglutathione lyase|uniref:VOC family protein n=1 Tax=[Mycobacterium] burgundiense TaxID=3064286 RepID=A0ABN9NUL8_9MYCO|nr:VOC family protein [Mycolicibacterium sp. MU0053]CAJ1510530.1 VOC family protein [Mycolicibacterium sp. MU0053]
MHRILLSTFLIDAPSDVFEKTTEFWAGALDAEAFRPRGGRDYRILEGASDDYRVVVQNAHSGQAGVHFDIHTDDLEAEVERLKGLGATVVDDSFVDHPGKWVIMADPAGKQFCVVYALNPLRPQEDRDAFERKAKPVG